jgi:hypothetical protein
VRTGRRTRRSARWLPRQGLQRRYVVLAVLTQSNVLLVKVVASCRLLRAGTDTGTGSLRLGC